MSPFLLSKYPLSPHLTFSCPPLHTPPLPHYTHNVPSMFANGNVTISASSLHALPLSPHLAYLSPPHPTPSPLYMWCSKYVCSWQCHPFCFFPLSPSSFTSYNLSLSPPTPHPFPLYTCNAPSMSVHGRDISPFPWKRRLFSVEVLLSGLPCYWAVLVWQLSCGPGPPAAAVVCVWTGQRRDLVPPWDFPLVTLPDKNNTRGAKCCFFSSYMLQISEIVSRTPLNLHLEIIYLVIN